MASGHQLFQGMSARFTIGLPGAHPVSMLDIEIEFTAGAIGNDFLAVEFHFEALNAGPFQVAYGFRGFLDCVLSGLGKALFGNSDYVDDFLSHGNLLLTPV